MPPATPPFCLALSLFFSPIPLGVQGRDKAIREKLSLVSLHPAFTQFTPSPTLSAPPRFPWRRVWCQASKQGGWRYHRKQQKQNRGLCHISEASTAETGCTWFLGAKSAHSHSHIKTGATKNIPLPTVQ